MTHADAMTSEEARDIVAALRSLEDSRPAGRMFVFTFELADGRSFTGPIVDRSADGVVLNDSVDGSQQVTVPWDQILRIGVAVF